MKKQFAVLAAVCAVALALGAGVAWAAHSVVVNVPFAFIVDGNKTLPTGQYEISAQDPMRLRSPSAASATARSMR